MEKLPLLKGRNYIETLVLNLTMMEILYGRPAPQILKRLEDEICALSLINDEIGKTYVDLLNKRLRGLLPEGISVPIRDPCNASEELWKWIKENIHLLKKHLGLQREIDNIVLEKLNNIRLGVIRSAILATLHKCGLLTLYPSFVRRRY